MIDTTTDAPSTPETPVSIPHHPIAHPANPGLPAAETCSRRAVLRRQRPVSLQTVSSLWHNVARYEVSLARYQDCSSGGPDHERRLPSTRRLYESTIVSRVTHLGASAALPSPNALHATPYASAALLAGAALALRRHLAPAPSRYPSSSCSSERRRTSPGLDGCAKLRQELSILLTGSLPRLRPLRGISPDCASCPDWSKTPNQYLRVQAIWGTHDKSAESSATRNPYTGASRATGGGAVIATEWRHSTSR